MTTISDELHTSPCSIYCTERLNEQGVAACVSLNYCAPVGICVVVPSNCTKSTFRPPTSVGMTLVAFSTSALSHLWRCEKAFFLPAFCHDLMMPRWRATTRGNNFTLQLLDLGPQIVEVSNPCRACGLLGSVCRLLDGTHLSCHR